LDAEGFRASLDDHLKQADSQASMIEASAPSRERFGWAGLTQVVLVALAIVLLIYVIVLKRAS